MTEAQLESVESLLVDLHVKRLHHGDCIGADAEVHLLGRKRGIWIAGHPPTDPSKRAFCEFDLEYEPLPYLERDIKIVETTGFLIAAPRTHEEQVRSGTWFTYRQARKRLRKVFLVTPDGQVWER